MLISVGPSLTGLVMQFILDDEAATRVEGPLRADYSTKRQRNLKPDTRELLRFIVKGGTIRLSGQSIWLPDQVRRQEVRNVLETQERDCRQWVKNNLPGAFSAMAEGSMPTCALLVTKSTRPFTNEARKIRAFEGLGIDRLFDSWSFREWPGGSFGFDSMSESVGNRIVVGTRRKDAFPPSKLYDEPESNWTLAYRINELLAVFLARWATGCLLAVYREKLLLLQDSAAKQNVRMPISNLKKVRHLFRTTLLDLQSTASEVLVLTGSKRDFHNWVIEPQQPTKEGEPKLELLPLMRDRQQKLAAQLQLDAAAVQSTLSTMNDFSLAMSSMRLQRLVIVLTVVSIGLASLSAFLAYLQLNQ
jgi:hypothetical protein